MEVMAIWYVRDGTGYNKQQGWELLHPSTNVTIIGSRCRSVTELSFLAGPVSRFSLQPVFYN